MMEMRSNLKKSGWGRLAGSVAVVAALVMGLPSQRASAEDVYENAGSFLHGFYIEGRFGGALKDDFDGDIASPNVPEANGELGVELDDGVGYVIAVGKYFAPMWRADLAIAFGKADDISLDYTGAPLNPFAAGAQPVDSLGDITATSVLFSVYRVLDMNLWRMQPFVGVGIGFTHIDIDGVAPVGSRFVVDDSDTVFTLVHHFGVDVPVHERIDLTVRYSGIWTDGAEFGSNDTVMPGSGIMTFSSDSEYVPAISAGVRVKLN